MRSPVGVGFLALLCTVTAFTPPLFKPLNLFPRIRQQTTAGVFGLRAQDSSQVGWLGRPGTSIKDDGSVRETSSRVSVTGTLDIKGAQIKYDYLPGDGPTIMYLPALNRTRHGEKSTSLKTWCRRNKRSFFVADYFGVGQSQGEYKDATISRWVDDTCTLIDWLGKRQAQTEVLLVGAGVGGWVMLHATGKMPKAVIGLIGVAADPDFTEDVVLPKLSEEIKKKIYAEGQADFEWGGKPYTLTKNMIEDGRKMRLLDKGTASIPVSCPVRLIQGLGDEEIPPERALKLSDAIQGKDVVVTYVKYATHEMDDTEDEFKRISFAIQDIDRANGKKQWRSSILKPV